MNPPDRPEALPPLPGFAYGRPLSRGTLSETHLYTPHAPGEPPVVVKCPRLDGDRADEMRVRFAREVLTLGCLAHPNIIRLLGDGEYQGTPYLVTPYCAGGKLEELVRGRPPLGLAEAWAVVAPVLDALEYAEAAPVRALAPDGSLHANVGVVHRDITPRNILFAVEGGRRVVKVADWGMAKAYRFAGRSGVTDDQLTGGTPGYMSRQHYIAFRDARPEVDVWSAAATLYFLLTKQTPREFPDACDDPHFVVAEELPIPIRDHDDTIPEAVARVIDDCLDDSGELMFESAAVFRTRMAEALAACGAVAPGPGVD